MTTYGDFSASQDPEDPAYSCTPGRIPILPMRFSLLPYELDSVAKPSSITSPGDYIIRETRRGFIYIFAERAESDEDTTSRDGVWSVFRRGTDPNDPNADEVPENTEYLERGSFNFQKYEWTDNYGRGDWSFTGEVYQQCWVPVWASKIWVAYSEYRWPPSFFRDAHNPAVRAKLMTPVDLRGTNQWAAYTGEARDLVEEWQADDTRSPTLQARLNLSQTAFRASTPNTWPVPINEDNDKCIAVVAVMDPLGDIAEMNYRLELKDSHQRSFSASNIFPLSVGHICEQLAPNLPARDAFYNFSGPALKPGWQGSYEGLRSISDATEGFVAELVKAIKEQVSDEGNWMLGQHLKLSGDLADGGDLEAQEYYSVLLGRALGGLGITAQGSQAISQGLGADISSPGPSLRSLLSRFRSLWGATGRKAFDSYQRKQYSFRIVMEAVGVELGAELGNKRIDVTTWADALDAGFRQGPNARLAFSQQTVPLDVAIDFMSNTQTGFQQAGYSASDVSAYIDDAGEAFTQQLVSAGATADVPVVRTSSGVKMVGGFDAMGRIELNGLAYAGAGLILSTWGLVATARGQAKADGLFERGMITGVGESKPFQLTMAAVGVAEGLRSTFTAASRVGATRTAQLTAEVVETVYQGAAAANIRGLTLVSARTGAAGGGVGQALNKLLPKVAIVVGLTMSAIGVFRGIEREDNSQIVGNALMFIGGLMLIPGLNVAVAILGGIILVVGLLISFTGYSALEDVARTSFWGSTSSYHSLAVRPGFSALIAGSRDLPGSWKDWFETEIARFSELSWKPIIENPVDGDNLVTVRSEALRDGNVGLITVEAWNAKFGFDNNVSVRKTAVPGQPAMILTLSGSNGDPVTIRAEVRGTLTGIDHETEEVIANP